jgi:hypothetical protein
MLNEHLTYIYLQEDLQNSAEEIINNVNIEKPNNITATKSMEILKKVPDLDINQIKKQAEKNPKFRVFYNEALAKLGDEKNNPIGEGLAVLYATSKTAIEATKDSSLKTRLLKYLDKLFDSVWNNPGKLAVKGFKLWVVSFMILFLFWWIPTAREIVSTTQKAAMIMMMIGLVFAIVKFFMKRIYK